MSKGSRYFLTGKWADIIIVISVLVNILYMQLAIAPNVITENWNTALIQIFCHIAFDTFFLLFISYIISALHLRAAYIIAFTLSFLWSLTNVVYFRFFSTYFNYHSIIYAGNLSDGTVIQSISSIFEARDIIWLLSLCAFVAGLIVQKRSTAKSRKAILITFLSLAIFSSFSSQGLKGWADAYYILTNKHNHIQTIDFDSSKRDRLCAEKGIFCGQLFTDKITYIKSKRLSDSERMSIYHYCDSLFRQNDYRKNDLDKNLIFILVESYLSCTSDLMVDGVEITPNLNRLRHSEKNYYNGRVKSNVALGESFDGQMIYMTGLLPLQNEISAYKLFSSKPYSLPYQLKAGKFKKAYITVPTAPGTWSQDKMNVPYDIDSLFSYSKDVQDAVVFNDAIAQNVLSQEMEEIPFFHMILTLSMHSPYDNLKYPIPEKINFPSEYSEEFCNYLCACHYTDEAIGQYIQQLKSSNLFDNSIIIIAADHPGHEERLNMANRNIDCLHTPLYIINCPVTANGMWDGEMEQVDIYSTILDLYGISSEWEGLGCSILEKEKYCDRVSKSTTTLSQKIIENYLFQRP